MRNLIHMVPIMVIVLYIFASSVSAKDQPQFTIVHLTDIHYTSTPPKTSSLSWKYHIHILGYKLHKKNLAECSRILRNTIQYINEKIKPDLVVITGDIVNRGDDKEGMRQAKDMFDKLNCPYYPVIGDHDLNKGPDRKRNYKEVFGEINYSLDYKGWHLIMLGVYPDDNALTWLKNELDENIDKPAILCMHRMLVASWLMKKLSRRYYCPEIISPVADQIIDILNNHGRVKAVLSGHSHTNYQVKKNKISYISTPSLMEPPYQFKVIKVYQDRISTSLKTAHPLKKR